MTNSHANRNYKDSLFRMIFKEKRELLSLYNAINDSDYTDPEQLEVRTLESSIYIGMKNDISFLIDIWGRFSAFIFILNTSGCWPPKLLPTAWKFGAVTQGCVF